MFELSTLGIAIICALGTLLGAFWYRDTLHPLVYTMPMVAFMYVIQPYQLTRDEALHVWFSTAELNFVQGLNLACIATFFLGTLVGSKGLRRNSKRLDVFSAFSSRQWRDRLFWAAVALGGLALTLYAYGLSNVGGFLAAYDSPKGGGWAGSGYLRDFTILSIPAIVLLFMSRQGAKFRSWDYMLLFSFLLPLLIHGLLSARRGPTFMGIVALVAGWYLSRNLRPSLWRVLSGGALVGFLLLALVTFRGEIYLGSAFFSEETPSTGQVVEKAFSETTEMEGGNEFVYGTYTVVAANEKENFYWGRRYLTHLFVRPIPSSIWPTKYQDVGMGGLVTNAGTLIESSSPIYDELPLGAAPGFVGDLFVEFQWGAAAATFVFGWFFAFGWRRMITHGGLWTPIYTVQMALSLYLISQTVEAVLVRFLVIVVPTSLAWLYFRPPYISDLQKAGFSFPSSSSQKQVPGGGVHV